MMGKMKKNLGSRGRKIAASVILILSIFVFIAGTAGMVVCKGTHGLARSKEEMQEKISARAGLTYGAQLLSEIQWDGKKDIVPKDLDRYKDMNMYYAVVRTDEVVDPSDMTQENAEYLYKTEGYSGYKDYEDYFMMASDWGASFDGDSFWSMLFYYPYTYDHEEPAANWEDLTYTSVPLNDDEAALIGVDEYGNIHTAETVSAEEAERFLKEQESAAAETGEENADDSGAQNKTGKVTETEKAAFPGYYWFFFTQRDPLLPKAQCNDFFRQGYDVLNTLYPLYRLALPGVILAFIAGCLAFAYLMWAAGHRPGQDQPVPSKFDRFPYLLMLIAAVAAAGMLIGGLAICVEALGHMPFGLIVFAGAVFGVLGILLGILVCMTTAVRIKTHTFKETTLIYHLTGPFRRIWKAAQENLSLFWLTVIFLGILTLVEMIVLGATTATGMVFVPFILYKLAAVPLVLWGVLQFGRLQKGTEAVIEGNLVNPVDTDKMYGPFKKQGETINRIGEGVQAAVDAQMKSERMKTELITNVSHDIKTPLTSIINYVDLIDKEQPKDPTLKEYVEVLKRQSARLKKLIEDLTEASKASSGNIEMHLESLNLGTVISQSLGEFEERLKNAGLDVVLTQADPDLRVLADGRYLWRVFDNLYSNICKYALPGTRVYIDTAPAGGEAVITFKNISREGLNISADELMERFVRGDSSRSTEGSGLGLSISNSLVSLMKGSMKLDVDGDLFKVTLRFQKQ